MNHQLKIPIRRPFVLSGGGARGYAHIGVLKAFEEQHIFPAAIAATSAGSIAAAFICDGYTSDEVRAIFQQTKMGLSMQWKNMKSGFLSLKTVEKVLRQTLRHTTFESLPIPLYITATDYNTGRQAIFSSGEVIPAVLAASTIPMLFQPVVIAGIPYIDGGISGNLPIEPLSGKYEDIVGVHVNPPTPYDPSGSMLAAMDRTMHMAIQEPVLKNKQLCSLFIEPAALGQFGMFDFKRFDAIYNVGLEYAREVLQVEKGEMARAGNQLVK
ncbi:patatin-like phospholipase family protein [Chitinophaga rhizophila]|uniref:Patatin-like phospholipase family protein n=1 Tax=Chitinophaga rhizophila TaxID=2866212 RepID=A0ABS7G6E2_9BACT|nr:patatin-like phospholipase family protein [Chitinophaga rhizophila]MBW8683184.1 patatin-like phospholipase family protein [Chitinophaga rhizophila]